MTRDEERARELIARMSGSPVTERIAMLAAALGEAEQRGENAAVAPLLAARTAAAVAAALEEARKSHETDRMLLAEARAGWKRALDERDELRNAICKAWR